MPRRPELKKILLVGAGPIVIGQACEFDYSGTQALKALREEGCEVVLVNSNPATIMTDPSFADRTYIEPITASVIEQIVIREKPDAVLPTVGGQTALNVTLEVADAGVFEQHGVEVIGAKPEAIRKAEDRQLFHNTMLEAGLDVPRGSTVQTVAQARALLPELDFPISLRPAFTLGGTGGGTAYNIEEFDSLVEKALTASPISEVLVEEYLLGWKEFELEVVRDRKDNCIVICSIENIDPMGIHTGDSITVAPSQTLSDRDYQKMRDWGLICLRAIGVETGGSNVQFAIHPQTGRMVVIEMNPRVSRSSALASKATGFPIAKVAAKLALGYTLDEIPNDITRKTLASFEPTIDYVVCKIPRWDFAKFRGSSNLLGIQMKSVGEVMSIGRTFKESIQKGMRSLEIGRAGLGVDGKGWTSLEELRGHLMQPVEDRLFAVADALRLGMTVTEIAKLTYIDPWFLEQIAELVDFEERFRSGHETLRSEVAPT